MIDLTTLIPEAIEAIKIAGPVIKDTKEIVTPLVEPAKKFWNWLTGVFEDDKLALEQLEAVQANPNDPEVVGGIKFALNSKIANNAELQMALAEHVKELQIIIQSSHVQKKKYVQKSTGDGNYLIQDSKVTFNQGATEKKKHKKS